MEEDGSFTCTNMFTKEKEEDKKEIIEKFIVVLKYHTKR